MATRLDDVAARATAQSLDEMLAELESLPDSPARSLGLDSVDALLQLYGEGLARVVVALRDGRLTTDFLGSDDVLSQLLAIHDLLPRAAHPPTLVTIQRQRAPESLTDADLVPALKDEQTECRLCAAPIAPEHRHLVDVERREILCACGPCAMLFDGRSVAGGRYRLIPRRYRSFDRSSFDDELWQRLELPVDVAFMFSSSRANRPVACYPGPMGTTESSLPLPAWADIVARLPVLETLAPDVEALLVRRTRGARDYWLVPIDECYRLAGAMRLSWQGISGGDAMRAAVDAFFRRLSARDESLRTPAAPTAQKSSHLAESSWAIT